MDSHFLAGLILGSAFVGSLWYGLYLRRTEEEWEDQQLERRRRYEERLEWRGKVRDAAEKRKERSERTK